MILPGAEAKPLATGDDIRPARRETNPQHEESRIIGDFAWASGRAWDLRLSHSDGRRGWLEKHPTELSQEGDEIARARYQAQFEAVWISYFADVEAPRATESPAFRTDADAAIREARARGLPYFLYFRTDRCGPCEIMDSIVFTSASVAEAASGVVLIKIDGDERDDSREWYGVRKYPTGILFGADGAEIDRFVEYQSVKAMPRFFQKASGH